MKYSELVSSLIELSSDVRRKVSVIQNTNVDDEELLNMQDYLQGFDEYSDYSFSASGDSLYLNYNYVDDFGEKYTETVALPEWFVSDEAFGNHIAELKSKAGE